MEEILSENIFARQVTRMPEHKTQNWILKISKPNQF